MEPPLIGNRLIEALGRPAVLAVLPPGAGRGAHLPVVASFVSSVIPILTWQGIDRQTAANIAGSAGVATIIGRLTGGYLLDRTNGNIVGAVSVGMAIVPSIMLLAYLPLSVIAAGLFASLGRYPRFGTAGDGA